MCGVEEFGNKGKRTDGLCAVKPLETGAPYEIVEGREVWHPVWGGKINDFVNATFTKVAAERIWDNEQVSIHIFPRAHHRPRRGRMERKTKRMVLTKEQRYGDLKRVSGVGCCWHMWSGTGKNDLEKKKDTPCCLSWADTEKPKKSAMRSKDTPDYGRIKRESEEKEEGWKRYGLYDRAPKQTSP